MSDYLSRPVYDDINDEARADWAANRPDTYDPGNQEPDPGPVPPQPVDSWLPYTCPNCEDEDQTGMPQRCHQCGHVNYGELA